MQRQREKQIKGSRS